MHYLVRLLLSLVIFSMSISVAEELPKPVVKYAPLRSALIPGWGEQTLNYTNRGLLFSGIEALLWVYAGASQLNAAHYEDELFYHAVEYAEVEDPESKPDVYFERIAKYESMDAYNAEMLRNREFEKLYSTDDGEYWEWDSEEKQTEYRIIKADRYHWQQQLTYSFGIIVLNHLVSSMDALYLQRLQTRVSIRSTIQPGLAGISFAYSF